MVSRLLRVSPLFSSICSSVCGGGNWRLLSPLVRSWTHASVCLPVAPLRLFPLKLNSKEASKHVSSNVPGLAQNWRGQRHPGGCGDAPWAPGAGFPNVLLSDGASPRSGPGRPRGRGLVSNCNGYRPPLPRASVGFQIRPALFSWGVHQLRTLLCSVH